MGLESDFLSFIKTNQLFSKADKLLLALSGGKDSVALFHLLLNSGFEFEVAHCNFQLRGVDSDGDETFVKELCGDKIVCHTTKFETENYAKVQKVSIQMAARALRYHWFEFIRVERGLDYILTAHHLNDRLETLLFNMAKGSGPAGYRGMPLKTGHISRPLLFCSLESIQTYLDANNYVWREDSSNAETKYSRNKIRAMVIPALKEINPGLENTANINFKRLDLWYDIFKEQLKSFEANYGKAGFEISYLQNLPGGMLLFEEYIKPFGFTFQQVSSIFDGFSAGKTYLSGSYQIFVGRTHVRLEKTKYPFKQLTIHKSGDYQVNNQMFKVEINNRMPSQQELKTIDNAFLDNSKINWPLTFRVWEKGDVFIPFGMKGRKLVSDYLIDIKMEVSDKERQMVLCDQNKIVWLAGQRVSEEAKISKETTELVSVKLILSV